MISRRSFTGGMLAGALAGSFSRRAGAADWPNRPIKLIVPFAPGGNTDGISRVLGQYLGDKLGASFVVENRVGAGGAIAVDSVVRAAPDGYTMMMVALPQIAILPMLQSVSYDPAKDLAPICNVASNPFCLVANPQFEPKTIQELVAYVKARPGQVAYASGGSGSLSHLTMLLFLQRAGLDMVHVPYKGGSLAITDVIGNQVPMYFGNLSEALPNVGAGKPLRALAVSGSKRAAQLPEVPTIAEIGFPGFVAETWNGLVAPAKTPEAIIARVAAEAQAAVKDPEILKRFDSYGVEPVGSSPAEFARTVTEDIGRWGTVIKTAKINP
jgi:tripartite-type tricarboxylate transporter receptor subunit TctC